MEERCGMTWRLGIAGCGVVVGGQLLGAGSGFVRKWWWVLDQGVLDKGNFVLEGRGRCTCRIFWAA